MYIAMIFPFWLNTWFKGEGKTPEEALAQILKQHRLGQLTYRPADGTIYAQDYPCSHVPCGVIFKKVE